MYSHPSAPIQILTVDTRKPCNARRGRLHDDGRSFRIKLRIERRFESSPESRGSQTSGVLPVLFVQAKRINPFPFREARGSANLDSARRNGGFAQTKLNPLPLCLLETWSPCSRPFAILPVSAVSDAQKLATGNFLHVRATFSYFL